MLEDRQVAVLAANGGLDLQEVAVTRLGLVVEAVVLGPLLGRVVIVAEQRMVLRSIYSENALDVVEEVRELIVVVFLEEDLDALDLREVLLHHELLNFMLRLYKIMVFRQMVFITKLDGICHTERMGVAIEMNLQYAEGACPRHH